MARAELAGNRRAQLAYIIDEMLHPTRDRMRSRRRNRDSALPGACGDSLWPVRAYGSSLTRWRSVSSSKAPSAAATPSEGGPAPEKLGSRPKVPPLRGPQPQGVREAADRGAGPAQVPPQAVLAVPVLSQASQVKPGPLAPAAAIPDAPPHPPEIRPVVALVIRAVAPQPPPPPTMVRNLSGLLPQVHCVAHACFV
jgi:hypothetical protein